MESKSAFPDDPASRALLDAVGDLAPRIAASAAAIERDRRLPEALVTAMVDAGLFRMTVPRSLGGGEVPLGTLSRVIEAVAKADASTAWCVSQNAGVCELAAFLPREGAREIFGPRTTAAGGHGPATAERVPGGYRLTGQWAYGSGVRHATWLRANCEFVDSSGPGVAGQGPEHGILFIPAAEATISDVWQVSGLRGTGSDTYAVKDLFVPAERAVRADSQEPGTLYVFGPNQVFSIGFASVALGVARASLDALIDLAATKTPRGITGFLRDQPMVQAEVARAEASLRSARAFLHQTVEEAWLCAAATRLLPLGQRAMIRLATTYAIQQAAGVADVAYHNAGGTAIFADAPFERRFRDMHAVTQQVQARSDHFEYVGQFLFGMRPESQWL